MKLETVAGVPVSGVMLNRYFHSLINLFFKILPIWENGEPTIFTYMRSLQAELLGCNALIVATHEDPQILTLVSILQFLIDHPEKEPAFVRREVFRAISICEKLERRYTEGEGDAE